MLDYLIPVSPLLVPLAIIVWQALRRRTCPDCAFPLPIFYSPLRKTRRMWRAGGYLCARCGCEADLAGRKVTADTAFPPFPAGQWELVGVFIVVGLGLAITGWLFAARAVAAPPLVALPVVDAPPVIVAPQPGPPAAPAP
jgi:hypothetical protein